LVVLLIVLWPLWAGATTDPGEEAVPDEETLERAGALIGEILIEANDIFDLDDPEENNWAFRTANRLHIVTKPRVIRNLILFKPGDPYRARVLEESERILRSQRYLYDASIEPIRYENGRVDVRVRTRDVWTLTPGLGYSRAGGEDEFRIGIEDSNVLGYGKEITIRWDKRIDRTQVLYRYRDPAVLGSRITLEAQYADNSDGFGRLFSIARPFYAQDVRWAASAVVFDDESVVSLYDRGEIFASFQQSVRYLETSGGIGRRTLSGRVLRGSLGYTFEEKRFTADPGGGTPPPEGVPPDRTLAYPWVGFETFRDRFVEVRNLDRIMRTEDLYVGNLLRAELGISAEPFGAEGPTRLVYEGLWRGGRVRDGRDYLLARFGISGRYGAGVTENLLAGGALRAFFRQEARWAFVAEISADVSRNLDPERQLVLGGDTGLRGYPIRYARGDRRWLVTLEQRFYSDWELLKLVHVGAAVFLDVGRAWFEDGEPDDLGILKDVGIGLRLSSSRSSQGGMVHVDFAVPLDGEPDIRRSQIVIRSRDRF
jgi:hypothetical protein